MVSVTTLWCDLLSDHIYTTVHAVLWYIYILCIRWHSIGYIILILTTITTLTNCIDHYIVNSEWFWTQPQSALPASCCGYGSPASPLCRTSSSASSFPPVVPSCTASPLKPVYKQSQCQSHFFLFFFYETLTTYRKSTKWTEYALLLILNLIRSWW